jgi:hypothetical protein
MDLMCVGELLFRVARWYIFSNQKSKFGYILEGLAMEDVGIFLCPFGAFTTIWYILWLFGIFFPFWYVVARKIWQPCSCLKTDYNSRT